ncbi:hypothetical protein BaRGS_00013701 [Batillaria attramentaria]|uniref:GATA-type domain-containing protein n=1 Tax=Batillaria attramentaria TaxID=370345 RepID=A0ABD0L700_9CAEN
MPFNIREDRVICPTEKPSQAGRASDSTGRKTAETSRDCHKEVSSPCSLCNKENLGLVTRNDQARTEEDRNGETGKAVRRQRRKPLHPQKSPSLWDPNFRGVTLHFHTVVHGGSSELIITPFYSKSLPKLVRRRCRVRNSSECDAEQASLEEIANSGDEQHPPSRTLQTTGTKSCASCGTRRTPLWRDAEDGTPLCNACGIRYRKYRMRCGQCWHIPRKDNKVYPACSQCGGVLRFAQNRKS